MKQIGRNTATKIEDILGCIERRIKSGNSSNAQIYGPIFLEKRDLNWISNTPDNLAYRVHRQLILIIWTAAIR